MHRQVLGIGGKGGNAGYPILELNPMPNEKCLDSSKLKDFEDDKLDLMKMAESSPIE